MAKEVFGEFSAYTTPGGIRFQQRNKLVSEKALPPEVVAYLKNKLETPADRGQVETQTPQPEQVAAPTQQFPKPTDEQLAAMREESIRVPEHLQLSPEEAAARALQPPVEPVARPIEDAELLAADDFDVPEEPPLVAQSEEEYRALKDMGVPVTYGSPEPTQVTPDFMEQVSIHTAPLEDIMRAVYDRFGIYSVYLNQLPSNDEVNPLTGEMFTKYHLGIAYQSALRAASLGYTNPDTAKSAIDEGRYASQHMVESLTPVNPTSRKSFDYRTSVAGNETVAATRIEHVRGTDGQLHAVQVPVTNGQGEASLNGAQSRPPRGEEDEPILEPPIFGGGQIIRPNW